MSPRIETFLALDVSQRQAEARRLIGGNRAQQRQYHAILAYLWDHDRGEYEALTATSAEFYRV